MLTISARPAGRRYAFRVVVAGVRRQKSLALIQAREVATNLSIPIVLFDPEGPIVFYNRAAETLLGLEFAEAGEISAADWARLFTPEDEDGTPIPLRELPAGVALLEQRPAHRSICFTGADGVRREISLTAFPLMGREEELHGAVTFFWPGV
jgi:PAS domain-containing protein